MKIFILGQSLLMSDWSSLSGDKYRHALPFSWSFTDNYKMASVIAWDGLMTPRSLPILKEVQKLLKEEGKILLLQVEALTLFKEHPFVHYLDLDQIRYVELPLGGTVPEDILSALETCHKKLNNV
jgi:hypothetical protein